ncbi:MAG: CBS domain-containing protein [Candidatus Electryoneaceae bacterium]|nr:CBS domain-containing protein [Candidatus Electryoneaceae bacterium]
MTVRELLRRKGSKTVSVRGDCTVYQAVKNMADNRVGSVIVVDDQNHPIGIFTERDVLNLVSECFDCIKDTTVAGVMTQELIIVVPDDDIESLLCIMTDKRVRHMPVMDEGELVGMISIGDIVKESLEDSKFEIRYMRDYIMGKY